MEIKSLTVTEFVLTAIMILAFLALFNWAGMVLWNWLMPAIFGISKVTFWQFFGLQLLSTMLIRSTQLPSKK